MGAVQSLGRVVALEDRWMPSVRTGVTLYNQFSYDYATLYRTQPNVRTCVDFLARNIAQLGLHVFRRIGETDRQRLRDHPLALVLNQANPYTTRYRLIESLMADLGIYFNAYWLKVKAPDTSQSLLRVPATCVTPYGGLAPTKYEIVIGTERLDVPPAEMVHFRGYSPESAVAGLSPLETLRRVLAEEFAMGDYREHFWQNSARMGGIIERPADAAEWSDAARERFLAEFSALYAGGTNSGQTAVLEEGMQWKEATFNAQESEYLAGRKLTREECARAYHIPLPMVGILDHATFSNIREQHKNLYQDCLGPWLKMIEEEVELQLLPDYPDRQGVYVEFNFSEKLAGSFEEKAQSYSSAAGRPWMTVNEVRARENLPSLGGDADMLVTPLNVLVGGQASPLDSAPDEAASLRQAQADGLKNAEIVTQSLLKGRGRIDPTQPKLRETWERKWAVEMARHFERQRNAIMPLVPATERLSTSSGRSAQGKQSTTADMLWDGSRWNKELFSDIFRLNTATASAWGQYIADEMGEEWDPDPLAEWLSENARIASEEINAATKQQIADALTQDDPREAVKHLFEIAIAVRAAQIATSKTTTASTFGATEAAKQTGLRVKTWQVNSANPRPEHAAMNGETVGIGELFSNGMRWPGDPLGGAENNANCNCSCLFGRE